LLDGNFFVVHNLVGGVADWNVCGDRRGAAKCVSLRPSRLIGGRLACGQTLRDRDTVTIGAARPNRGVLTLGPTPIDGPEVRV
jgi:hypothetical protein